MPLGNGEGQIWGDMKLLIQNAASVLHLDDPKDPCAMKTRTRYLCYKCGGSVIYRYCMWAVEGCGSGDGLFKLVHPGC
jgi:hypothetical protein